MTTPRTPHPFEHKDTIRALLYRLHAAGENAWRTDPEAAELMRYAADRFAALAHRYGLDPWEAAGAAYESMLTASAREAEQPWAVITRAVQITCIFEARARGLLCSVRRARKADYSHFHDAERFSDRENPLTDYDPHFTVNPFGASGDDDDAGDPLVQAVGPAIEDTTRLFTLVKWPEQMARDGIEYVCARLAEASNRRSAFEALRRDYTARALLDIPGSSWLGMLRIVLGRPDPVLTHTNAGRGVLLRLVVGEPIEVLLTDDELLAALLRTVPRGRGRS